MKEEPIHVETILQKASRKQELYIWPVASPGTSEKLRRELIQRFEGLLPGYEFVWTDVSPDLILFLTGGSEKSALERIGDKKDVLLMAFPERNAYASASEVKSFLDRKGIHSQLFNLADSTDISGMRELLEIRAAVRSFAHARIGIIGNESEWLVNSMPDPLNIKARFGFKLIKIPWAMLDTVDSWPSSPDFLDYFGTYTSPQLAGHSRIYGKLLEVIEENELDGITVECFPLVQKHEITACPALALLNTLGIPAGCEGDLVSLTGMMLIRSLTGKIPWMANLAGIMDGRVWFSHCTVPFNLVETYGINTHYETGKGMAVQGEMPSGTYTVFRLSVDFLTAYVAEGEIHPEPRSHEACRTQVVLSLQPEDYQELKLHPLGNHHLLLPGQHKDMIWRALGYLNITQRKM